MHLTLRNTQKVQAYPEYMTKLKMMVSPFILRRLKTDKTIISDLPDKMEITEHVDLSKRQVVLYRKEVEKAEQKILDSTGLQRRGIVIALLTKLKQICNHPDQFIHDTNYNPKDSGKYAMLKPSMRKGKEFWYLHNIKKCANPYLNI